MGKKTTLILSAFFVSALLHAQQTDTLAVLQQRAQNENADFSFTESQLNEDDDAGQTVSAITGVGNDLYLSEVGYLFSPMRFRLRAYQQRHVHQRYPVQRCRTRRIQLQFHRRTERRNP